MAPRPPPDVKAAAVADLTAGEQPVIVAERYGLNPNTVRSWKDRLVVAPERNATAVATSDATCNATVTAPIVQPTVIARRRNFQEIVFDLLCAKLEASEALARAATNPEWLSRQTAADVATLGQWLDQSALALGDRLANAAAGAGADPDDADPAA